MDKDKEKEISEYDLKIKEFKKDKNSDMTIHQFSKGNNYSVITLSHRF